MSIIEKKWYDDIYTKLTDTLADSEHNINSGITKPDNVSILKASDINNLINSIQSLKNNSFLKNYADCFVDGKTLTEVSANNLIKSDVKAQTETYVTDILNVCNNITRAAVPQSGCTQETTTFRAASGNTNFRAASGNSNFRAASGKDNFSPAFNSNTFHPASGNSQTTNSQTRSGNSNVGRESFSNRAVYSRNSRYSMGYGRSSYSESCSNNTNRTSNSRTQTGFNTESNLSFSQTTSNSTTFRAAFDSNTFHRASGNTNFSPASGNTNFTPASGDTNFTPASGTTAFVTTFRAFQPAVYGVKING